MSSSSPICFVIMPFSQVQGVGEARDFTEFFDKILSPIVEDAGFHCVRSQLTYGNFVSDIVVQLLEADVVIADLTGQKANVFYELGVRHALRGRTLMIAQNIREDIPSGLQSYACGEYDPKDEPSLNTFQNWLGDMLADLKVNYAKKDNPVHDHIDFIDRQHMPATHMPIHFIEQKKAYARQIEECSKVLHKIQSGVVPVGDDKESYFETFIELIKRYSERIDHVRLYAALANLEYGVQFAGFPPPQLLERIKNLVDQKQLDIEYVIGFSSPQTAYEHNKDELLDRYKSFAREVRYVFKNDDNVPSSKMNDTMVLLDDYRYVVTHTWDKNGQIKDALLHMSHKKYDEVNAIYKNIKMYSNNC